MAKAGKLMFRVVPLNAPKADEIRRVGFLNDQVKVPADFDRMGEEVINELFCGSS